MDRIRVVAGEHDVLWNPEQAAWSGRRCVGTGSVCNVVLSVAVAVVLGGTDVFGGGMRSGEGDAKDAEGTDFRREVVDRFAGIDGCRSVCRAEREL